jgi:hypothetical protein
VLHVWPRFQIQYLDGDVAGLKRCHGVVARYLVLNAFHIKPIDMFTMSSFPTSPSHAARHTQGSVHPFPSNQRQEIMKPSNQQTHVTTYNSYFPSCKCWWISIISTYSIYSGYPPLYIYIPYILYIYYIPNIASIIPCFLLIPRCQHPNFHHLVAKWKWPVCPGTTPSLCTSAMARLGPLGSLDPWDPWDPRNKHWDLSLKPTFMVSNGNMGSEWLLMVLDAKINGV